MVLDVAHAVLVDRVREAALAERQVAAVMVAAGGKWEAPNVGEALAAFEADLVAPVEEGKRLDPEQSALRRALGVA